MLQRSYKLENMNASHMFNPAAQKRATNSTVSKWAPRLVSPIQYLIWCEIWSQPAPGPELRCWIMTRKVFLQNIMKLQWCWPLTLIIYPTAFYCYVLKSVESKWIFVPDVIKWCQWILSDCWPLITSIWSIKTDWTFVPIRLKNLESKCAVSRRNPRFSTTGKGWLSSAINSVTLLVIALACQNSWDPFTPV